MFKSLKIKACRALSYIIEQLTGDAPLIVLDTALHLQPARLKSFDGKNSEIEEENGTILLSYGFCGRALERSIQVYCFFGKYRAMNVAQKKNAKRLLRNTTLNLKPFAKKIDIIKQLIELPWDDEKSLVIPQGGYEPIFKIKDGWYDYNRREDQRNQKSGWKCNKKQG